MEDTNLTGQLCGIDADEIKGKITRIKHKPSMPQAIELLNEFTYANKDATLSAYLLKANRVK